MTSAEDSVLLIVSSSAFFCKRNQNRGVFCLLVSFSLKLEKLYRDS